MQIKIDELLKHLESSKIVSQIVEVIIDEMRDKKAIIVSFDKYGALAEDIEDIHIAHSRKKEPRATFEEVKARYGKLKKECLKSLIDIIRVRHRKDAYKNIHRK
jgi:hypothetical protein